MARKRVVSCDASQPPRARMGQGLGGSAWQLRQRQEEGARHAKCFERFERGVPPERVVIELQLPCDEVARVYAAWVRMVDGLVFRFEGMTRKDLEAKYGVKATPDNLRKVLEVVAYRPDLLDQLEQIEQREPFEQAEP